MHIVDLSIGVLGANGEVAGGLLIASGAGMAVKIKKTDQIVVVFFGDGASNIGAVSKAMNWCSVFRLTVIFIVENNHFADFLFTGMTAVTNQIMKFRYMTGGQAKIHLVLRGPAGITKSGAAQHSESIETLFMHIPGIKIIIPATPYDMKGLFKTALKSDDPVICFEHKRLNETKGFIPDEEYYIPSGSC